MTDSLQVEASTVSMKTRIVSSLLGTVVGAVIGLVAWNVLFEVSATAVLSIGRFDSNLSSSWIEEPQAVIERIKSPGFASAVALRAGVPDLAMQLPARQYGGSGALNVRSLRDLNLLEIRIAADSPEVARKAINAVTDEIIADHSAKMDPFIQGIEADIGTLNALKSETIKSDQALSKRIGSADQSDDKNQDSLSLLATRSSTERGLAALMTSAGHLRLLAANLRKSKLVTVPSVVSPKTSSLYRTMAAGALAGLLCGLLVTQMFSDFFQAVGSRRRVSQPKPT